MSALANEATALGLSELKTENMPPVESRLGTRIGMALSPLLLAGCVTPLSPNLPPSMDSPTSAKVTEFGPDSRANRSSGQTRVDALPGAPLAATKAVAPATPKLPQGGPKPEAAALSLEQIPLGTFAQLVFADVLKRNVNVDAKVLARRDLVSFRSGATQDPAALADAATLLLRSYGVAVVDAGGLVRIVLDAPGTGTLPEIRRGTALPETPAQLRPVFHLIELQAVRQTDAVGMLRTLFGDRVRLQEDATRNALLLSATPDTMAAVLEALQVIDSPVLAGAKSMAITPAHWSADDLARRLSEVLSAQGYAVQPLNAAPGGIRYPIILLPVPGLNAVFVFARGEQVLDHVVQWAKTLDRPNEQGIGRNFFTYAVKHTDAAALAQTLEQLLTGARPAAAPAAGTTQNAAPSSGRVVVDKASNTLIFQAGQDDRAQMMSLLQALDRPARAALIEVTVAELSTEDADQLGVEFQHDKFGVNTDWTVRAGTQGGLSLGTGGLNIRLLDAGPNLRVALNALASNNRATILSSPRVMARNGEQAVIQVGQEVPIITSQQSTNTVTNGGSQGVLQTIQYRNTGVILRVKPVIHSGDQIDLDVAQEVSQAQTTNTGVNNSPTFGTRKLETKLTLRNGTTMMLGGLISEAGSQGNAGVPLLKDIPVLGQLFRSNTQTGSRRELIVLITPYVVNDEHDSAAVTRAFRKQLGTWAQQAPIAPQGPREGQSPEDGRPQSSKAPAP